MWCIKSTIFSIIIVASLIKHFMCTNTLLDSLQQQQQEKQHARQTVMLKMLLKRIGQEEAYETCAIFKGPVKGYNIEEILQKDFRKAVMLHDNVVNLTKFITIAWWHKETKEKDFIKYLAAALNFKRQTKVLVIKQMVEENTLTADVLFKFFSLSKSFKLPNLITVFKDFHITRHVYQFDMFPQLKVLKRDLKFSNFSLFPNKLRNLYGYPLRSMPDQSLPRTAVQYDKQGLVEIKGYIMKFLNLFTQYLNATLVYPMKIRPGKVLMYEDLYYLTQNNFIDLPAGLSSYQCNNNTQLMSHFLEVNKWCLMIPIEKPFSYKAYLDQHINRTLSIYFLIGRYVFSILLVCSTKVWSLYRKRAYVVRLNDFLINSNVCAGMIAGSFKLLPKPSKSLRLLYISLFLCGLMYSILVSVQLQSFLTHPYAHRITTLHDIKKNNLKILIAQIEYDRMLDYYKFNSNWMSEIFVIAKDYEEFSKIQASFNTSYVYPTISPLWFIYNALQTYRNKPLFRLSSMCYPLRGIMSFVLPANFLFTEPLNCLITRVRDMGLLEFWLKISYVDFVKMGKIYMREDRNVVAKSNMLNLEDFQYIWINMGFCFGLALAVFVTEVLWFKLSKKIQK